MKAKDLRGKTVEELLAVYDKTAEELFQMRFQTEVEQIGNPADLRKHRRDVARILTVLREKGVKA